MATCAGTAESIHIVPDDVAQELARIAGLAIVSHPFNWTLPPIALFQRETGAQFTEAQVFAQELRRVSAEMSAQSSA